MAALTFDAMRRPSLPETLCACAAVSGTGIVHCAPAGTLSCNGGQENA
ncbi:hypothetical protein [Hoeflea sp.]|nr:hypothetical protein [Hoeflea sp.]MBC7283146.1 hypothetical protein [Hoeflea sp.]